MGIKISNFSNKRLRCRLFDLQKLETVVNLIEVELDIKLTRQVTSIIYIGL